MEKVLVCCVNDRLMNETSPFPSFLSGRHFTAPYEFTGDQQHYGENLRKVSKPDDWTLLVSRLGLGPSTGAVVSRQIADFAGVLHSDDLEAHKMVQRILAEYREKRYFGKRVREL